MNYIIALLIVGFIILAHEAGHFIAAMVVKVPIKIFSIGFGPKIWAFRKGSTEYRISLIPLGGYVLPECEDEKEFFSLSVFQRTMMTLGGPVASFLLPVFCFALCNLLTAGFVPAAILLKPFSQLYTVTGKILSAIPAAFSSPGHLSGIVSIVAQGGQFISGSPVLKSLQFMAILSINLGVLNLIPIPALDGGKVMLYLLEKAHPVFRRLHLPLAIAGWIVIVGLFVYVTVIDIVKFFQAA
jgi:membrane-associated protease RseP (regulator of RpoE activity)